MNCYKNRGIIHTVISDHFPVCNALPMFKGDVNNSEIYLKRFFITEAANFKLDLSKSSWETNSNAIAMQIKCLTNVLNIFVFYTLNIFLRNSLKININIVVNLTLH